MTTPAAPAAATLRVVPTEAQSRLLSAAAQGPDGRIARPEHLHGLAAERLLRALVLRGLIAADPPGSGGPAAHRPPGQVSLTAYRITLAGLAAIGVTPDDAPPGADGMAVDGEAAPDPADAGAASTCPCGATRRPTGTPRLGTKGSLLIALLSRERGARLDEPTAARPVA